MNGSRRFFFGPTIHDSPCVPAYAETALRDFLTCGLPGEGVAIATCEACGHTMAIPFSCKRRCPCPSCSTKFMSRTAARLVEEVVPEVPMRCDTGFDCRTNQVCVREPPDAEFARCVFSG